MNIWLEEVFKQISYIYCWLFENGGEENRTEEPDTISNDSLEASYDVFLDILVCSWSDEHWIE